MEAYENLVNSGKAVCSKCVNALYTGETATTESYGGRAVTRHLHGFKACLLSVEVKYEVHQCSQFVASETPYKSLIPVSDGKEKDAFGNAKYVEYEILKD